MSCSKCDDPAVRSILIHNEDGDPPPPGQKDRRGVKVLRFCAKHWAEIKALLPV
jgi:hypothetical protein